MFKGSGFYATDSKAAATKATDTKKETGGEKSGEAKPAAESTATTGNSGDAAKD
jgi:predicted nucleic acid-binding Zn ribbon protein